MCLVKCVLTQHTHLIRTIHMYCFFITCGMVFSLIVQTVAISLVLEALNAELLLFEV